MINIKKYDITADWIMNLFCNFNCEYCFTSPKNRKNIKYIKPPNINKIIDFFNKTNLKFLIHMTGGEPFLYHNFIRLCEELTKKHYISINTNLTTNFIYDFAKKINPKKVEFIHCSLHISEREKLNLKEDFIKKFKTLENAGFNIFTTQIMHPKNFKEFDKTFKYFKDKGIIIYPKVFRGEFNKRQYPQAYNKEEKEKLNELKKLYKTWEIKNKNIFLALNKESFNGESSFKDSLCSAGRKFIVIEYNGTIKRCHSENKYLGNLFKGKIKLLNKDKPCISEICQCPYDGLTFSHGNPKIITKQPSKNLLLLANIKKIIKRF